MGNSASADIFFGIVIYDPDGIDSLVPWITDDDDDDASFDDWASSTLGKIIRPNEAYPDRSDKSEEADSIREKFSDVWKAEREFMESIPIEEDHIGYMDGYSQRVLRLKGWGKRSGYKPEAVEAKDLEVTDEHRASFAKALADLGLVGLPDPQVYLAASYG